MKILPAFVTALLLLSAAPLLAHRVNIHAWVEGRDVQVRCAFSRASPAKNGRVTVYDASNGQELLNGLTDGEGAFRFPVPDEALKNGLRIRINAGEGHENQWLMEAGEFAAAVGAPDSSPGMPGEMPGQEQKAQDADTAEMNARPYNEDLRRIVSETLDAGLAPLRRDLAALTNPEPGPREIVGGLGWLVGLAGIILYFRGGRRP
ncbi:MAG: cobalamin biosynthesis protein CbiL [Desulfovibrio sp.]|nr:cobalamin biosynthesis protein CbiL [Desulfovibrio sp.]